MRALGQIRNGVLTFSAFCFWYFYKCNNNIILNLFFLQHWEYDKSSNRIRHVGSGKCLDSKDYKEKGLVLNSCIDSFTQTWAFEVNL